MLPSPIWWSAVEQPSVRSDLVGPTYGDERSISSKQRGQRALQTTSRYMSQRPAHDRADPPPEHGRPTPA